MKKLTDEHKQKISDAKKGIPLSDEHKQNIANSLKNIVQSDSMKQNRKNTWKLKMEKKRLAALANSQV